MFDNIPFISTNHHISQKDIVEKTLELSLENKQEILAAAEAQEKNQFYIDGKTNLLFPLSIPEEYKKLFFYPQFFCVIESGEKYYTSRKNFASYEILYTYEGEGSLFYQGKWYSLKRGQGFFIDCMQPHFYCTKTPVWVHGDLHFDGPACQTLFKSFSTDGNVLFYEQPGGKFQTLLEMVLRRLNNVDTCGTLAVSNSIGELLAHLFFTRPGMGRGRFINEMERASEYIRMHYREELSVAILAKEAAMSESHFAHEFRKYHNGLSPIRFLLLTRIENAKQLLLLTDIPVHEVAELCGFQDINNFTRQFKKQTGANPSEFRK